MSYGTKYHYQVTDVFGVITLVNLKLSGYSGTDNALDQGGITFEFGQTQATTVVRGASAKVGLWSLTQGQFAEFRDITDRSWMVEVIKGGNPFWYGWLTPEIFSEPFKCSIPYRIELVAVDGLGDLTNIAYPVDFSAGSSLRVNFRTIINQCLINTGLALNVCFSASIRPNLTSGDVFDVAYYSPYMFVDSSNVPFKCSDVLESFLPLGITVKQCRGKWYVIRTEDLTGHVLYYEYDSTGAYVTDYYLDLNETIDDTSTPGAVNLPLNQSGIMSQVAAYKEASVHVDYGKKTSMLDNPDFINAGDNWTGPTGMSSMPALTLPSLVYGVVNDVYCAFMGYYDRYNAGLNIKQSIAVAASPNEDFCFSLKYACWSNSSDPPGKVTALNVQFQVSLHALFGGTTYYLNTSTGWSTTPNLITLLNVPCTDNETLYYLNFDSWKDFKCTTKPLPIGGILTVTLFWLPQTQPAPFTSRTPCGLAFTNILAYHPGNDYLSTQDLKGVNNSACNYIPSTPSLIINDAPNLPNALLMYRNYISNASGIPTTLWGADGITGSFPLAELYLRHDISAHRRPLKVITMNFRGNLEWGGTMTDRDGNFYEVVSATLDSRNAQWNVQLREILEFQDLSPVISVTATTISSAGGSGTAIAASSTLTPTTVYMAIISFTATQAPTISGYDSTYASTHGQFPNVRLITIDGAGNRLERAEKPKFVMVSGIIDSIVYDLAKTETGFIILT